MFVCKSIGHLIAVAPKCASTSIANQFHVPNLDPVGPECAALLKRSGWTIAAVVRDPIDRLESAYNFFRYGSVGQHAEFGSPRTIFDFADSVLSGLPGDHWEPQARAFYCGDALLPTEFVRLEDFCCSRRDNKNAHTERIGDYRSADLADYYAEDMRMRTWQ